MSYQRVALGVIQSNSGHFLISKRPAEVHLGGYFEFPGGKAKGEESFKIALRRELYEELGIHISSVRRLIHFTHCYSDLNIYFQVFKIIEFQGEISAMEDSDIKWVANNKLEHIRFPPANKAIIDTLLLSNLYMIADYAVFKDNLLDIVGKNLAQGIKVVQFRAQKLTRREYLSLAKKLKTLCEENSAKMICNCDMSWVSDIKPHGIHLNSRQLRMIADSNVESACQEFFSVSCHNKQEIEMANKLNIRCILLGSVHRTLSHPNARQLGWAKFNKLCDYANVPVFALGGVNVEELRLAEAHGAHGVAGIRTFMGN